MQNAEFISITAFLQAKRASNLSDNTIISYQYHLRQWWQYLCRNNIDSVTEPDVIAYFVYLRSLNYAASTLRDKYTALHALFRFSGRENLLQHIRKPEPSPQARAFTDIELSRIFMALTDRDGFVAERDYCIVSLLLGTGIRKSELLNIDIDDISEYITVTGKGNKTRKVPLSATLQRIIYRYLQKRSEIAVEPRKLFLNREGYPLTQNGVRAIFTRLQKKTGIPGKRFSPHTFRHTYATNFLKAGGSIASLQRILGHNDIQTTMIYCNWDDDQTKIENDRFCPLDKFVI